ncbi:MULTISPECIES: UPF0149 family protein [Pseudoalteromonas]|uniref:UPF0149 family protein n=1 Tax=Pseudoalteromonas rubra TaxID=43658 RepID=A0A5S3UR20_9GAMM|nr:MULTISPECIES: UPF0149 family protein [Pseudoalteromonas]MCG7564092.1 UPF0149 family protein [Pseudoalteromonas sp. McH1-42]MEC4091527.1 UPF0149 family protein [Pseudoalteromonas rubra]QPB81794.1 UPF0149 family protein [Pseudoalteromonas rubra]
MMTFNYDAQHQTALTNYLEQRPGALSLRAVEGYLFGLICSPDGIEPEQWLSELSLNDEALEEHTVFAFLALHHHISEQVFSEQFALPAQAHSPWSEKQQWSQGFLLASQPYYERLATASEVPQELVEALQMATEQLAFFSLQEQQVAQFCQQSGQEMSAFCAQQLSLANDFAQGYAALIEQVALASGLYNE